MGPVIPEYHEWPWLLIFDASGIIGRNDVFKISRRDTISIAPVQPGAQNTLRSNPGGIEKVKILENIRLIISYLINLLLLLNGINMSTYTQILYQVVFGSKSYTPFLTTENENILFAYISGILRNKQCYCYIIGGASNHLHIITHLHPSIALASLIKDIKIASQGMIMENKHLFSKFPGWQVGYGAFTYNISSKKYLIQYVESQKEHHKVVSYKNELISILKEHDLAISDDYLLT
ncbi:MAG: transposase [Bacteroidales bacterium]